jgi:hypothetical protein
VNWERDGEEMKAWADPLYGNSGWSRIIKSVDFYFRPGLTWPLRTQLGFNMRAYPRGAIFGHKGPVACVHEVELPCYLGLANSSTLSLLISLQMAFGSYEVGVIQRTPVPDSSGQNGKRLGELALSAVNLKRLPDAGNETSHAFHVPALLQVPGGTLAERFAVWQAQVAEIEQQLAESQREIDNIAFHLYGIEGEDRRVIEESLSEPRSERDAEEQDPDSADDEIEAQPAADPRQLVADLLSYAVGCVFGRWDIRFATGERRPPDLPDPFAPLPVCSPGMLTGDDGLPLRDAPPNYPLRLDRDGILVDDPDHPDDLVRRVREALEVIWQDRAEAIEHEACEILGVKELRDYFRKPGNGGFWMDHVRRYSKSRRKAPIYWLLQSSRKNYALWLYYPRLDKDILFKALINYVEPKLRLEESRLEAVRRQLSVVRSSAQRTPDTGPRTADKKPKALEKQLDRQEGLLSELRDFHDKLRRAADLHLDPDLNDGVILNIAPLWELVPWAEARKYWHELSAGQYDWSSIGRQWCGRGGVGR